MSLVINSNVMDIATAPEPLHLYYNNNTSTYFRGESFFTKEPETLLWLNSIETGSCLWDIGANVGIYSLYAAKKKNCTVFAFEPSIFNLEMLGKNAFINNLHDKIHIIPAALSATDGFNKFILGDTAHGGALSAFGADYGFDGKPINSVLCYSLLGLSGDSAAKMPGIQLPDYIKIDVDGTEHRILEGMKSVLCYKNLKSVIVEGNENFSEQVNSITDIMTSCGFRLLTKKHGSMFEKGKFSGIYNQIWIK